MSHQALRELEAWFVTGSQHLYGPEVLRTVEDHARQIAECLDESPDIPVRIVPQRVVTTPDEIARMLADADATDACIGVIAWMHTFSPGQDVDRRPDEPAQAAGPPAHAVQPRSAVGARSTWTS